MISKFVKQLQKGDGSYLWMDAGARGGGRRDAMPEEKVCLAQRYKLFQILVRSFSSQVGFVWFQVLGQRGIVVHHNSLCAISVQLLDRQQVRQNFADRPAIRRRLPLEDIRRNVAEQGLQDGRGLLQQGYGRLR